MLCVQLSDLHRSIKEARAAGQHVRAMAVINPGNPTGGCLSKENMRDVIEFCTDNNIVLMADEVYQVCHAPVRLTCVVDALRLCLWSAPLCRWLGF